MLTAVTQWMPNWKRNGWRTSNGQTVKNKDDFIELDRDMQGIDINWVGISGCMTLQEHVTEGCSPCVCVCILVCIRNIDPVNMIENIFASHFGTCTCSNVETILSWTRLFPDIWVSNIPQYFCFAIINLRGMSTMMRGCTMLNLDVKGYRSRS